MERQQTALKGEFIGKAIGIIGGLREGLDLQKGGELGANLDSLYQYMLSRLFEANVKNDTVLLDEVAAHLDPSRRAALYARLAAHDGKTWLTGTEAALFAGIPVPVTRFRLSGGRTTAA